MKSDKKTVLIFTDWYLPGYKAGGPISSCANLVSLSGDDFNFKVICGDRDYLDETPYPNVTTNEWLKVGKAEVMYLSPERQNLKSIRQLVNEVEADVAYLNGMFSQIFTIYPLLALREVSTEVVVAPRGMLAPAAMALKSLKKKGFLNVARLIGLFKGVKFHATNVVEFRQIAARLGQVPIEIVANIPAIGANEGLRANHRKEKGVLRLYTVARIAPEKNIDFALECLRELESGIEVQFDIIGAIYDQDYYAKCKKIIEELPKGISVNFIGTMPNNRISDYAAKADFFFLPTLGENYGHAIVEALLAGVPAVISTETPWRDLAKTRLGFDLPLDRSAFAEMLSELGQMDAEAYVSKFKNVRTNAGSMIKLDKLRDGYMNLFNG
jgi:glycosyltransferase involved in cell wall biosynthesis